MIDEHGHIGRILSGRLEFIYPVNLFAMMDSRGINITCALPLSEHPEAACLECDREDIISACARYPGRLIPLCLIEPRYGNRHDMNFSRLPEEYAGRGWKGMGEFLPKFDFDDSRCINLFKQAESTACAIVMAFQNLRVPCGLFLCYIYRTLPRLPGGNSG